MIKKFIVIALLAMMLGLGMFGQTASATITEGPSSRSFGVGYTPTKDVFVVGTATSTGTLTEAGYIQGVVNGVIVAREETTAALIVGLSLTNQMSISFLCPAGSTYYVNTTGTQNYIYEYVIEDYTGVDPVKIKVSPERCSIGQHLSIDITETYMNGSGVLNNEGYTFVYIYYPNGSLAVNGSHPQELNYGCYYYDYQVVDYTNGTWRVYVVSQIDSKYYADIGHFVDPDYSVEEALHDIIEAYMEDRNATADAILAAGQLQSDAMNNISDAITNQQQPNYTAAMQAIATAITNQVFAYDNPNYNYSSYFATLAAKQFAYDYSTQFTTLAGKTFAFDYSEMLWEIANITAGGGGSGSCGYYPTRDFSQEVIPLKFWLKSGVSKWIEFDLYYRRPVYANYTAAFSWASQDSAGDIAYVSNISVYSLNVDTMAKTYIKGYNLTSDYRAFGHKFTEPGSYVVNFTINSNAYTHYRQIEVNIRDDAEIRWVQCNNTNQTNALNNIADSLGNIMPYGISVGMLALLSIIFTFIAFFSNIQEGLKPGIAIISIILWILTSLAHKYICQDNPTLAMLFIVYVLVALADICGTIWLMDQLTKMKAEREQNE